MAVPPVTHDTPIDVLIVGAGLSGIGAACWLQKECPDKRYVILEARDAMGGTWDLFRYPGVRSDSDMYTLGYAFKPWLGENAIADGPSIRNYIEDTAREHDLPRHIRYGHKVVAASWSSETACWTVDVEQVSTGTRQSMYARFLYMCSGYYSYTQPHRPEFAGETDFRGTIVLPQFWPKDLDYAGKRVVVVGSGATAMTIVPTMAKVAEHVTMLQRSPTYVAALPSQDKVSRTFQRLLPKQMAYRLTRLKNVLTGMVVFWLARRIPKLVSKRMIQDVSRQLGPDYDVKTHFTPRYNPWNQRVCVVPDGDLFTAMKAGQATVVTDEIERFATDGLLLKSGQRLPADVVVLATGLTIQLFGGMRLTVDGESYQPSELMAYKGMMLSDIPNMALAFGYTNASWTLKADLTARYVCRLLRYMDRKGYTVAVPRKEAAMPPVPFIDFSSGYVQRASNLLPQQGARRPWQVYQNYLQDTIAIRYSRLADGVLRFGTKGMKP
jgi:cyclohexanone monooxygenase